MKHSTNKHPRGPPNCNVHRDSINSNKRTDEERGQENRKHFRKQEVSRGCLSKFSRWTAHGEENKNANENSEDTGIAVYNCLPPLWDWTEMEIEDKQSIPHYYPATCTRACCVFLFFFFKPLSVYCERLISACVCYSSSITGWCALILNFCPSYFYFFPFCCLYSSEMSPISFWICSKWVSQHWSS